ncbi:MULTISPECIES: lipopolysaccharide biosynthesis protein [unclassified Sphingomonas]|uniref:lipopolysaccharide biosynthesis protein n=1 Tax=unclassified Sphingomonas TaxID=196159 RepID=UPI00070156BF|nr:MULTISPECIES: hypothetical protein [unclassified Sphingomonas]KQM24612.1 hypothetical protein ASE58_14400 [Sphingomonas sp. Leaf9]KQM42271.1 hypothetical protein ASE57_14405 [Sphingomonas sp. Leaf11]
MNPRRTPPWIDVLRRYGLVSGSSAFVSVAHFAIQLVAIARLPASGVGLLAFAIVLIQLGFGLSNALVCAPYSILAHRAGDSADGLPTLRAINLALSAGYGVLVGIVMGVGASSLPVGLGFGATAFLALIRWFGRNHAYAADQPMRAALSDLLYAAILGLWAGGVLLLGGGLAHIAAGFVVASLLALVPFGSVIGELVGIASFGAYRPIWRDQASWALVGVVTSEATTNGHAYLVTAMLGPDAFAPLSVAALFLRPLNVCVTALTQTERPRMARDLSAGRVDAAERSRRHFLLVLLLLWAGTIALAAGMLWLVPGTVVPAKLDAQSVEIAVVLTGVIALLQCLMTPSSVLLQAADRFRALATASMVACGVSIAGVVLVLTSLAAAWSLIGILLGQMVMMWGIVVAERRWRRDRRETVSRERNHA